MGFADKFVTSCTSSNLMDDAFHHDTEALAAAAMAGDIGSLLCRVKYADGSINMLFERGTANLAQLLRIWTAAVTEKGRSRGWIKINNAWDIAACNSLYRRVAERSLAHWLDGACTNCKGNGFDPARFAGACSCPACKGSGKAEVEGGGYEREKTLDMISELEALMQSHSARASALLRRHL